MEGDGKREEPRIINFDEYRRNKALIGVLSRKELSEEIKEYPSSVPKMRVVYNRYDEQQLLKYILERTNTNKEEGE